MYNQQLDTFVRVAEAGSFSKAAESLYVSPTAVIKQMNLLEARIGVTLFNRTHHGLTLTRAGESLLADARHIISYSRESVERARNAELSEKSVIRVGVSLMTPATHLARLWPQVQQLCPNMSMQVVSFENSPHARRQLSELGKDMDVIAGVFDEDMLRRWDCGGLRLFDEPLTCSVSLADPLAARPKITLDDLSGRGLMVIRGSWDTTMAPLRERIAREHPDVRIVDFDQYRADVFNRCASEGLALATTSLWDGVNPMLVSKPTDWGISFTYGILHAKRPTPQVQRLLDAMETIAASESLPS